MIREWHNTKVGVVIKYDCVNAMMLRTASYTFSVSPTSVSRALLFSPEEIPPLELMSVRDDD